MLESVAHVAGNAWSHYVRGGVEPHVPTPSRIVHDEPREPQPWRPDETEEPAVFFGGWLFETVEGEG